MVCESLNRQDKSIDLVIPWVDGSDPEWQRIRRQYSASDNQDDSVLRYRDWGLLKYWFRGVERNLPWIGNIYLITFGHVPKWLNMEHKKLRVVRHTDYIPKQYLPTFSSHTIELNLHRIQELSERFIYCNDDTFFITPMLETDFFIQGLPRDSLVENITYQSNQMIDRIINNNIGIINKNFNKRKCIHFHRKQWFTSCYGKKLLNNIYYSLIPFFVGFENLHLPNAFLKSTFCELWEKEEQELNRTCSHHFRSDEDVNQWLMEYWQLTEGKFVPIKKRKQGVHLSIGKDDKKIKEYLKTNRYQMLCINDDLDTDFEKEKQFLNQCFESIFKEKSQFEK